MKNQVGILKNIQEKILFNPYRILGVTCESSVRDVTRQAGRLKKYLLIEENPSDFSFHDLDKLQRKVEDVEKAVQAISTDEERLCHALFWFWNDNDITDDAAFELLKENKPQEALDIWERLILDPQSKQLKDVTVKNASAFHNWSILKLMMAYIWPSFGNFSLQRETLEIANRMDWGENSESHQGKNAKEYNLKFFQSSMFSINVAIIAHLKLLDSSFWTKFKESITDKTHCIDQEQIELMFLNLILEFKDISLVSKVFEQPFFARSVFIDKYFYSLQGDISSTLKNLKSERKEFINKMPELAKKAMNSAMVELSQAKTILSTEQYAQLSDQVAEGVLQGVIGYFNYYTKEENQKYAPKDFDFTSLEILDLASKFSCSKLVKNRIKTNYETIKNYRYKEGMLALYALKEAWNVCQDIERKNSIMSLLGRHYEVNQEKMTEMLNKFLTLSALKQLVASEDEEALTETESLLKKLKRYISTSYWEQTLNRCRWEYLCSQSYKSFPDYSLERLLALLVFMKKNAGWATGIFVNQLKKEMSSRMLKNIADSSNKQQLKVWNALLSALEEFAAGALRDIEKQLLAVLNDNSDLKIILKKRKRNRIIVRISIFLMLLLLLGFMIDIVHRQNIVVQQDAIAYEKAVQENTIEGYELFIREHHTKKYVDLALGKQRAIREQEENERKLKEEEKIWNSLSKKKKYQEYLNQFPQGTFSQKAKDALEKQKWGTESAAWKSASSDKSQVSYQKYIDRYPKGAHVKDAKKKILEIEIQNYYHRSKGSLPTPDYVGYKSGSTSIFTILNGTSNDLVLYFSGPSTKKITIKKGQEFKVYLTNGEYRVVAVAKDGDAYTNTMSFDHGYYRASYYIQSYYVGGGYRRRY